MPETEPTRWCAWQRVPPGPWECKVTADSETECRRLFWDMPFSARFRDVTFLPEGDVPSSRPRRFL